MAVITISREFGSGGRKIGEKLAKELGINFYDRALIQLAAEKSGLSPGYIERSEENVPSPFLLNLNYTAYSSFDPVNRFEASMNDKVFQAQFAVIMEVAAQGSCVIVGRCADYILHNNPKIYKVFIHADMQDRIKRAAEEYNLPVDRIEERIRKIDKSRANYYKYYTNQTWANMHNYDLAINSSRSGIDGAVETIKALVNSKK